MRRKSLRENLRQNKLTLGSWITLGHPAVAEIMARAGFEWLSVDMEHSAITLHQAQQLIQVIELCGVTPLVRVGENNPNLIKRVMDAGAHGVIVPMVNTKDDAVKAVSAVKYPPSGTRGVGLSRAQGYGLSFDSYKKWLNSHSVVVVQIEHIKAVENIERILSVDGVDAFIVGPYDLSGSIGRPGEFNHPEMLAALKQIRQSAKALKKTAGFHVVPPDVKLLQKRIKEGYTFLAYSFDALILAQNCKSAMGKIKK